MGIFKKVSTSSETYTVANTAAANGTSTLTTAGNAWDTAQVTTANLASALDTNSLMTYYNPSTTTAWINSSGPYYYSINSNSYYEPKVLSDTISKLPTLLYIEKAIIKKGKLRLKYKLFFDKYLPNDGTLYLKGVNSYGIFNREDDKYWYKYLDVTCNPSEINDDNVSNLNNTYCILINDFDTKLDNTEIEELLDIEMYKEYAHELLEKIYFEQETQNVESSKVSRVVYHTMLDTKLAEIND